MKMKFVSRIYILFILPFLLNGCSKEGFPVPPASTVPLYSYAIDNDGFAPATVTFTNESIVPEPAGIPSTTGISAMEHPRRKKIHPIRFKPR